MIGAPFLLGPIERQQLHQLREQAARAPVDMQELMAKIKNGAGKTRHMRQMTAQTVYLPVAYAVTFSIEQNHPGGRTARHMSMSVKRDGRLPRPEAVWMVAEELGFTGSLKECEAWLENLEGHGQAVNVVQLITVPAGRA